MFNCDKCGLCCIGLNKSEVTAYLHDGDGICRNLDLDTMLCRIYEERPIFCDIERYYEELLKDQMDKEEFFRLNAEACDLKKKEWEECGRDIYKMTSRIPDLDEEKEKIIRASLEKV
ncbi:YkgJ family cysteine cluster protein [Kineothrix sp. MB12-C1]|uniref:YkgJ family cysteine cluster protein n=1 Tax=Kineothrix sp. MB12-C1 TaxID=3070215 RepID=UPI0027D33E51|nr:YkgJ family cysteine cluster protein [Kineothrix sp. MB12-C1]WMC93269.1 YkgJ family cysteine cluster protein [Kineothrix sp. MB12-C1]